MVKVDLKHIKFSEFRTSTSIVSVVCENIVRVEPFDYSVLSEEAIKEVFAEVDKRRNGIRVKWLMPTGKYGDIDKSATKFDTRSYHKENSKALAIVLLNLQARILFKFYLTIKKYPIPVKTFKTEEKAIDWLKTI